MHHLVDRRFLTGADNPSRAMLNVDEAAVSPGPICQAGTGIDSNLKDFVDRVVVPILVRTFLADPVGKETIAGTPPSMASCDGTFSAVEVSE